MAKNSLESVNLQYVKLDRKHGIRFDLQVSERESKES